QVKIRGFRLELGEIENRLLRHEKVNDAVVAARKDAGGDDYLCAYIVVKNAQHTRPNPEEPVEGKCKSPITAELREFLAQTLPDYMIPPYFVQIDKLPLNPNGKLNRKALPEPDMDEIGRGHTPPQNPCQEKLAAIWSEILHIEKEKIGIDTNFFEVGGHSLKATIMIARIHQAFDVKIPLAKIFEHPTILALSEEITKSGKTEFIDLKEVEKKEYYPLSFSQKRLWLIDRTQPKSSAYTMTSDIVLAHKVDEKDIRQVLHRLMKRHENFRTGFKMLGEEPVQFVLQELATAFIMIDLSTLDEQERLQERDRIFKELSGVTFDLSRPPLFRSNLLKLAEDRFEYIFCMHHIVSDGWSMEIVTDEFNRLYHAIKDGEDLYQEAVRFQYRDFSCWQNKQLTQPHGKRAYRFWKNRLEKGAPDVEIPGDFPGDSGIKPGSAWSFVIGKKLKERIKKLADSSSATPFTVMFSVYLLLISRFSGSKEVVCAIINSGREHLALHRITGFFVNSILYHNRIEPGESYHNLLQRINSDIIEVFNYQDFPVEPVLAQLRLDFPAIPASFNLLNMQDRTVQDHLEHHEPVHLDYYPDVKFDIESYFFEYKNCIEMRWTYNRTVYKPGTLKHIIEEYIAILDFFTSNPDKNIETCRHVISAGEFKPVHEKDELKTKSASADKPDSYMFDAATLKTLEKFAAEAEPEKFTDIEAVEKRFYYTISSAQKRLFILEQQGALNTTYNMPGAVKIEGALNNDILEKTFQTILKRHESLRTSFGWIKGQPIQRVHDCRQLELKIEYYDAGDRQASTSQFIRPFDLACAPLLRVGLIRLQDQEQIILFDMHHIISDGASMDILVREFIELYAGSRLPELRIQYKDVSEWQKDFFVSPVLKKEEEFWLESLKGKLPELQMPLDFNRPATKTFVGKEIAFTISPAATQKLNLLAKEKNITLNIAILSIYFLLLAKYCDQEDIIIASPVSGRNHVNLQHIIGIFGSALPIRNRIDPAQTFLEFLESSRQKILACYQNQDYPFEKMVDRLNPPVNLSRNPIFDTMLTFHNE
ncbi:MAG: condensation domain-containing protein, partial [Candidatus Aminicenantes bacterium]|nr:condensation domain-containing protein [Candidatus Aminicenantes bacterium]